MDATSLVISVIAWSFGAGYFLYGKKEQMIMPMVCGAILCIYPYFIDNVWISWGAGIVLVVLPFIFQF